MDLRQRSWIKHQDIDLFAKADRFAAAYRADMPEMTSYFQPFQHFDGPLATIGNREVLMMASNNYLGLATHPEIRRAAVDAVQRWGASCTGSRILNGSMEIHERLEARLAAFVGKEAALVFSTGYQASLGILTALLSDEDVVVMDARAHASLADGARLSGAIRQTFHHNDILDLERLLTTREPSRATLVVIDGVYSMEGDIADLPSILRLVKEVGARLLLDDAHGFAVLGPGGAGTASFFGLQERVDLIMGTFSKSLASIGGFVSGPGPAVNFIRFFGRSMLFSASLPPPAVAAADAALTFLIAHPELLGRLQENIRYWVEGLTKAGFHTRLSHTPIVPIYLPDSAITLQLAREAFDAGVYVSPIIYPAVPQNAPLLRTSVTVAHTQEHLADALHRITDVARRLRIITT